MSNEGDIFTLEKEVRSLKRRVKELEERVQLLTPPLPAISLTAGARVTFPSNAPDDRWFWRLFETTGGWYFATVDARGMIASGLIGIARATRDEATQDACMTMLPEWHE